MATVLHNIARDASEIPNVGVGHPRSCTQEPRANVSDLTHRVLTKENKDALPNPAGF